MSAFNVVSPPPIVQYIIVVQLLTLDTLCFQRGQKINDGYPLPTPTEESVFKHLGLPYRAPNERDHWDQIRRRANRQILEDQWWIRST